MLQWSKPMFQNSFLILTLVIICLDLSHADVYMHSPRGCNNRNCGQNENRNNNNRLFDDQNNNKGGYACPRSRPFPCYKFPEEGTGMTRSKCNSFNNPSKKNYVTPDGNINIIVDEDGNVLNPDDPQNRDFVTKFRKMYYYEDSILPIEWTSQHGGGSNGKVHSDTVIQVSCEDQLVDDCGLGGNAKCFPRDGTPANNQESATDTISEDPQEQDDYRRGRHESLRYYQRCKNRKRNLGLFTADQNLNKRDARSTRQNPGGTRYGLECPEEQAYWPYWHPSPWIDIAVFTSNMERCETMKHKSQNVIDKYECICDPPESCSPSSPVPNQAEECRQVGGVWKKTPSFREQYESKGVVGPPECIEADFARDNHLGNIAGQGHPYGYNWTVPDFLRDSKNCVLRIRYNISTGDFGGLSIKGTAAHNDELLFDRNNNPEKVYVPLETGISGVDSDQSRLALAVNTNQYGRTFQDRSYTFDIKPKPRNSPCERIHNLGVKGKRGNIVQVYPAVEYDFVPNKLAVWEDDCVHVQWTGSDYNPNRNPNNAEGGPPDPNGNNPNQQSRADRSNLVQMDGLSENRFITTSREFTMLKGLDKDAWTNLAFTGQNIKDTNKCLSYTKLMELNNNDRTKAERDHRNCAKISGAESPYFDAGLLAVGEVGEYRFMSTRNNNFSNRSQKGILLVLKTITVTTVALISAVGGAVAYYKYYKKRDDLGVSTPSAPNLNYAEGTTSSAPVIVKLAQPNNEIAVANFPYKAKEVGEMSFSKGDRITVTQKDASGWWEGENQTTKEKGIFPSNFCAIQVAQS